MREDALHLLSAKKGHFLLESGHHGDLWLDLESLCFRPALLKPLVAELANHLSALGVEAICGPLVEGAFVGLLVASELNLPFSYSERFAQSTSDGLFPAGYRVPAALWDRLRGKRVAIVNDVINAGSAVKGTFADLQQCGAIVVVIGSLLVLGDAAEEFARAKKVALVSLAAR
jgi:orotate phosphoribosyltransferase